MTTWLLKTEPDSYSYADLERDGSTVWDGVTNNAALANIRRVRSGDSVLLYHTGKEKAVVGLARVTSDPYPDPKAESEKIVVFDLAPERPLARPVTLAEIKADETFAEWQLVRVPRLSVMEVPKALERRLLALAKR
ncbi:MAG: EVE domain-containing protein [Thermoanaerobaculia bacterium]